jgi:phosphatidylethanolamine N-methyltransferase
MTKISSLGRWVPIHDEEWDGDLPLPLTESKQSREEDTDCGEVVFKKETLPWRAREYEVCFFDSERADS